MSFCNNDSFGQTPVDDSNVEITSELRVENAPQSDNSENVDENDVNNISFENLANINNNNVDEKGETVVQNDIL